MGQVLQRKEKENSSLNGKVEDEQTLGGKLNTQIKELQARLEVKYLMKTMIMSKQKLPMIIWFKPYSITGA